MLSKKRTALRYAAIFLAVGGVSWVSLAPAPNLEPAQVDDRAGMENNAAFRPLWGNPAEGAVDSRGIEADLDGNASALVASPSQ